MIDEIVDKMNVLIEDLKNSIEEDIDDIKAGKNEGLLDRNDEKYNMINEISSLKLDLNQELISQMKAGVDVNIYRTKVDLLEDKLKELYELNKRLASIVLPVKKMYEDLVDEISTANGGQIFDLKA